MSANDPRDPLARLRESAESRGEDWSALKRAMSVSPHDPLCPWPSRTCECPLIERVKEREAERYGFETS